MWTREELRREVAEAFKPDPPKPKPTAEVKDQEHFSPLPDEAILQAAAKSAEAQLRMAERWRNRRAEQQAK